MPNAPQSTVPNTGDPHNIFRQSGQSKGSSGTSFADTEKKSADVEITPAPLDENSTEEMQSSVETDHVSASTLNSEDQSYGVGDDCVVCQVNINFYIISCNYVILHVTYLLL